MVIVAVAIVVLVVQALRVSRRARRLGAQLLMHE
jgi:hypothetical protein